jgi:selenide,water dikinase
VGGGHAHALALRQLAMKPPAGARLTLISSGSHTPYSGMLPGLVAGHYNFEETHIDLQRFCSASGVRFVCAEVVGLDPATQSILLKDRPPLGYDILSINIGSQPDIHSVPGAAQYTIPVKPVSGFHQRWSQLDQQVRDNCAGASPDIVLVGGGAGSVELALAMAYRLGADAVNISLVCGADLLPGYNRGATRAVRRALAERGIHVIENTRIARVEANRLQTESGEGIAYTEVVWCTAATAPAWLREAGLSCDAQGFLEVEDTLQVLGQDRIFAAGDVATQVNHPRPKAGVYAVRQGPILADNLRAKAKGEVLRRYRPQRRFLSLLSLGDQRAVADKGMFWASGAWVWRWKNSIDRKFMERFRVLPATMGRSEGEVPDVMHCGGCGAKLPAGLLRDVLADMALAFPTVVDSSRFNDDAAILDQNPDKALIQSVDSLRELIDDPWIMGRVAALHALSDIHAMGARPHSSLAQITIPYASGQLQKRDLTLLMHGALTEMERVDCQLIGGHSLEGPELAIGFTVNGELERERLLHKTAVKAGDRLVLTRPLGTGVLFAALMQGGADGRWIANAVMSMLMGNAAAAEIARQFGIQACTDITGFGLAGHLLEMLREHSPQAPPQPLQARLQLSSIPLLAGVRESFSAGYASTLEPGNREAVVGELENRCEAGEDFLKALFDPQTSGGLLLAVEPGKVSALLEALAEADCKHAADIGELLPLPEGAGKLRLDC